MKEWGVYDNATIIITGDHGSAIKDEKPLDTAGEKYDTEVLYWTGYIYRYWACSRNEKSKKIYKYAPAKIMKRNYP